MSMIQEQLVAMLKASLSVKCYPMVAPADAPLPYVVYQRVASPVANTLDGNGNPPINQTRMQIAAWDLTYPGSQQLAASVTAAMLAWSVQNVRLMDHDDYDGDRKAYRVLQDYSIWSPPSS
ncbi:DUF3168 domain-containing protein [Burkholderia gladioli]|uniref:DUF3168 domain-containing protein n=1 Tax=Burkholderia gladioli TaxID=28095 RepID=UPI001640139B|nr:DUF3168 domain-containing protein [Burkholderia gladioli]